MSVVFRGEPGGQFDTTHYLVSDDGPIRVIDHNGDVTERFTLPADAYELVTRTDVYDEIFDALTKVKISKAAREAVESMLEGLAG